MKVYYNKDNGYNSYLGALGSFVIISFLTIITIILLVSAVYYYFIKKSISNRNKAISGSLILSLLFDVLYCMISLSITGHNIFNSSPFTCTINAQIVIFLSLARLFQYQFFVARYEIELFLSCYTRNGDISSHVIVLDIQCTCSNL